MSTQAALQIPEEFKHAVEGRIAASDFSRWGFEALVLEAVREGLITRGYGGELLGLGFHEREQFYASRGVSYDLSDEDLAGERPT
jgi:hypothetical protein